MSKMYVNELLPKDAARVAIPGHVIQVVQGTEQSDVYTVTTNTFTDTLISTSITPVSSNSKVLIIASWTGNSRNQSGGEAYGEVQVTRNNSAIYNPSSLYPFNPYIGVSGASEVDWWGNLSFTYIDSPSSTSSLTYKLQIRKVVGNYYRVMGGHILLMEIAQ